jgi:hypothetical protein
MRLDSLARIFRDKLARGPKQLYWDTATLSRELYAAIRGDDSEFIKCVWRNHLRFWTGAVQPISGQTELRAHEAVSWLLRAQAATPDGGVSYGYFPCRGPEWGWKPSYPETTGYIITSLLAYHARFPEKGVDQAALRMAEWEMAIQMRSGAVQGGKVCPPDRQTPAAFNTGMVLDGWCSVLSGSRRDDLFHAARRAADWLVGDMDERGYFRTNGNYVTRGEIKTYTCLCAWALYRFADIAGDSSYRRAAIRCIEGALRQQEPNGWFVHNCLARSEAPLVHTIGYTLQGILEVGGLAGREDFIAAVKKTVDQLSTRVSEAGFLSGCFYDDWSPAVLSSCLTGSAQLASVGYRLHELCGEVPYLRFADKLLNYLKPLQELGSRDPGIKGALAGSFPIFGEYMRGGYPNWATKYLLDALLLQQGSHAWALPRNSADSVLA